MEIWTAFKPSSIKELKALEKTAYQQAKQCIKEYGQKGIEALKKTLQIADIRKIVYDVYVWQRIEAIKMGTERAITEG